jgi:cytochrome c oxidase subunit 4
MRVYFSVIACLFVFTAITVAAGFLSLGVLNTPLALAIAIFKASLVVLFFMHVKYNTPLMWVFAGAGFFWLIILFALTMQDYVSRGWDDTGVPFLIQ